MRIISQTVNFKAVGDVLELGMCYQRNPQKVMSSNLIIQRVL